MPDSGSEARLLHHASGSQRSPDLPAPVGPALRPLVLLLAVVVALLSSVFLHVTKGDHDAALDAGWDAAELAAAAAGEHSDRALAAARMTLDRLEAMVLRDGVAPLRDDQGRAVLATMIRYAPQVGALVLRDADGGLLAASIPQLGSSLGPPVAPLVAGDGPSQLTAFGRSGLLGNCRFSLRQALRTTGGELVAIAEACFNAEEFLRAYAGLGLGEDARIGLFRRSDGAPLMLAPPSPQGADGGPPDALPDLAPDFARIRDLAATPGGRAELVLPDGRNLLVAWRAAGPAIAAAAIDRAHVLAPFERRLLRYAVLLAVALAVVALLGALVARALRATHQARHVAEARGQDLAATLEATSDRVLVLDAGWRLTYMNRPAVEDFADSGTVTGQVIWDLSSGLADAPIGVALRRAMDWRKPATVEAHCPMGRLLHVEARPRGDGGIVVFYRDITEAHAAATALATSEARLRMAAEAARVGVFEAEDLVTCSPAWTSPGFRALFGLAENESVDSATLRRRIHPDDRAHFDGVIAAVAAAGGRFGCEFRVLHGDGSEGWLFATGEAEQDAAGEVRRLRGVVLDISARKAGEAALAESEARLRLAGEAAGVGLFEHDVVTGCNTWSPTMLELHGFDAAGPAPTREAFLALVHPDDRARVMALRAAPGARAGTLRFAVEFRIRRADNGDERWIAASGENVLDAAGRLQRVRGAHRDITLRKRAESALAETEAQLRIAEEAGGIGLFACRPQDGITTWSPSLRSLYGLGPDAPLPVADGLDLVHPEDRTTLAAHRAAIADDPELDSFSVEYRICRADSGEVRWISSRGRILRDAAGRPLHIHGAQQDVTDRHEAARALAESEARLRLAQEAAGIVAFEVDLTTGDVTWAPPAARFFDLTPQAGPRVQRGLDQLLAMLHPDDARAFEAGRAARLADPAVTHFRFEWRLRPTADGPTERWVALMGEYVRGPDGTCRTVRGILQDVTDRRAAAQALADSEARLRLALEAGRMGTWDHRLDTGEATWNPRMYELVGRDPALGPTDRLGSVAQVHRADRRAFAQAIETALRQPDGVHGQEVRIRLADGGTRWISWHGGVQRDAEGTPTRIVGICFDVTDRRAAEAALRASAAQQRRMLDGISFSVAVLTPDGVIEEINRAPAEASGLTPAELRGRALWDCPWYRDDPDAAALVRAACARAAAGETVRFDLVRRDARGHAETLDFQVAPVRDEAGRITHLVPSETNVTAREAARAALAESEAQAARVQAAGIVGTWDWNPQSGKVGWSAGVRRLLGVAPDLQPACETFRALVHPDDLARLYASLSAVLARPADGFVAQFRIRTADTGTERWIAARAEAEVGPDGTAQRLVGTTVDITAQRAAEQALRASEERLRLATEAAGLATWELDAPQRGLLIYPGALPLLRDRMPVNSSAEWMKLIHPEDLPRVRAVWREAALTGAPYDVEYRLAAPGPDGEPTWLLARGRIEPEPDGIPRRGAGIFLDVTHRRRTEAALRESQAWLARAQEVGRVGTWEWVPATGHAVWSEGFRRLGGLSADAPASYDATIALVHPDDREMVELAVAEVLVEPGRSLDLECRARRVDTGEERWISARGQAAVGTDGHVERLIGTVVDITEARRTAAALRDSEARLERAQQAGQVGTWEVQAPRRLLASDGLRRLAGLSPDDPAGLGRFLHLVPAADRRALKARLRAARATAGVPLEAEFRLRRADSGEQRWVAVRGEVAGGPAGVPPRIIGTATDVTARRAAEQALRDSEERLRLATSGAGIGTWEYDAAADRVSLSDGSCALLGIATPVMTQAEWRALLDPIDQPGIAAAWAAARDRQGAYEAEFRLARRDTDGEERWLLSRGRLEWAEDGSLLRGRGVHIDVTARHRAETALRESELRFLRLMAIAPVIVSVTDATGACTFMNRRWHELTGQADGAAFGRGWLDAIHPDDVAAVAEAQDAGLRSRAPYRAEFRLRRADGAWAWSIGAGEPRCGSEGEFLGHVGVVFDISDRKEAEERRLLLAREVDHRAKNALAVVQSILGLTRADDLPGFRSAVLGRVMAMARAHTLLARQGWTGADMRELAAEELALHMAGGLGGVDRVTLDGPTVELVPGATQPLAMTLHELATNAVKHGALSTAGGRATLRWRREPPSGDLVIEWQESGGPALRGPPNRLGFGSSVITRTVERQLQGSVRLDWAPAGLRCELRLPASQLREAGVVAEAAA